MSGEFGRRSSSEGVKRKLANLAIGTAAAVGGLGLGMEALHAGDGDHAGKEAPEKVQKMKSDVQAPPVAFVLPELEKSASPPPTPTSAERRELAEPKTEPSTLDIFDAIRARQLASKDVLLQRLVDQALGTAWSQEVDEKTKQSTYKMYLPGAEDADDPAWVVSVDEQEQVHFPVLASVRIHDGRITPEIKEVIASPDSFLEQLPNLLEINRYIARDVKTEGNRSDNGTLEESEKSFLTQHGVIISE